MQRKSDLTAASSLGVGFSGSHEGNRPARGPVRRAGSRGGAPRPPAVSSQPCLTFFGPSSWFSKGGEPDRCMLCYL